MKVPTLDIGRIIKIIIYQLFTIQLIINLPKKKQKKVSILFVKTRKAFIFATAKQLA